VFYEFRKGERPAGKRQNNVSTQRCPLYWVPVLGPFVWNYSELAKRWRLRWKDPSLPKNSSMSTQVTTRSNLQAPGGAPATSSALEVAKAICRKATAITKKMLMAGRQACLTGGGRGLGGRSMGSINVISQISDHDPGPEKNSTWASRTPAPARHAC